MVTFAAKSQEYESSGVVGNAIGPTSVWGGTNVFYGFNISNSSTQTISYTLTGLDDASGNRGTVHWTSGSPSGSLSPGQSVSVTCTVTSPDSDEDNDVACTMLQAGATSLLTLGGQQLQFRFWTEGDSTTNQFINLCDTNGFSITENTAAQNNATGNGFNIGLGGGGGALTTENICIQVFNAGTSY